VRWNYSQDWNKIFGKKTLNIHENVTKTPSFERERTLYLFFQYHFEADREQKNLQFFNFKAESRKKVAAMRFLVCPFLRKICPTNLKNKKIKKIFSFFAFLRRLRLKCVWKGEKLEKFWMWKSCFWRGHSTFFQENKIKNIDI